MLQVLKKKKDEVRVYAFDFAAFPELLGGQTLTGSPTVTSASPGLTMGTPAISGSMVALVLAGGDAAATYDLACTVTTNTGSVLIASGRLSVASDYS